MAGSNDDRVLIFDTTLRDGEQCPGATMTFEEKARIAEILDEMGVDIIEAGFPIASNGDFAAVRTISERTKNATVCALSRANRVDIDRAAEALEPARQSRIHTFIATSPLHMEYKLQMSPDDVFEAIVDSVTHARNLSGDVEWGCEDGTRSDPDFLCRCFEAAIKAGAQTVNIADTVGYILPDEFAALIEMLYERVPGMDTVRLSVHCHDDLGLATSNSLAAIRAGARQVECTINGLGERAGNTSLEEVVMSLKTRADILGVHTGINTELLTRASRTVSDITGFVVPPNKAIVGSNAFAHESGIHQHGVIQHRGTYEIITPDSVGADGSLLVMGKHSGRHAFKLRLEELGYKLGSNAVEDAFQRFKDLADVRKDVTDDDIVDIIEDNMSVDKDEVKLLSLRMSSSIDGPHEAQILLSVDDEDVTSTGEADGPFEAIISAVQGAYPHTGNVEFIRMNALAESAQPYTKVTVRLRNDDRSVVGQGSSADPNVACARAYLHALNRHLSHLRRQIQDAEGGSQPSLQETPARA
jgi:2-isopropylmalate synthase